MIAFGWVVKRSHWAPFHSISKHAMRLATRLGLLDAPSQRAQAVHMLRLIIVLLVKLYRAISRRLSVQMSFNVGNSLVTSKVSHLASWLAATSCPAVLVAGALASWVVVWTRFDLQNVRDPWRYGASYPTATIGLFRTLNMTSSWRGDVICAHLVIA